MMPRKLIFFFVLLFLSRIVFSETDEFIFNGFKHATENISLNGVAEIENNGIIKLTDNTVRIFGHAFYSTPFKFKDSINGKAFSFSTAFAFAIKPEYDKLGGHGMAFAISPTKDIHGALPNQYLGLLNNSVVGNSSNHFFAVEFDNVEDVGLNDISDRHVGIDFNSLVSNSSMNVTYYLDENEEKKALNMQSGNTIQAWIDYDSTKHELNVYLSISSKKPKLSILSFPVDLSSILDEYAYVGFSASTGQKLASSHYVVGWSFKMNGKTQSLDLSSLPSFPGPKKSPLPLILGVSLSVGVFVVISVVLCIYIVVRIKNMDVIEPWEFDVGPHRYSYEELKKATKGFRDKELLGCGGFGKVYKGTLPSTKTCIAVKRINNESKQGLHEFVSEIATIGRLRHRNLVQLLGWCRRRVDLLLVYEFMPNGSLDKYLFDDPKVILTWDQRFKIIKGVAAGLLYLHEEWDQAVIHRDIKAGNVLLDSEMNGKLGDFGLAKLYEHGANPSTTRVVGTLGYLAPELTKTGLPSTCSDVFAFGALLLEVVCGRRPVELKALPEELILVDWVCDKLNTGGILEVVDTKLSGEFNEGEVIMVLKLGLMCSKDEPAKRPRMKEVVRYLDGEADLPAVVAVPVVFNGKKCASVSKFKDLRVSYPSFSYLEKVSGWASIGRGDRGGDLEAGSMSLLSTYGREEITRIPFKTRRDLLHVASF